MFTARPRKRIRKVHLHKSVIAKQLVERGAEHKTKNKVIEAKVFIAQQTCKCTNKKNQNVSCAEKINVARQEHIFNTYYNEMLWTQKTLFIRGHAKRQPVKTKKSLSFPIVSLKNREFNIVYSLTDDRGVQHDVCRDFFMNCLQITASRVLGAIRSDEKNPSASEKRGRNPPANKTKDTEIEAVRQFIDSIPKYESHYGRSDSERKYLHHSLNLSKLYHEYKENREKMNQTFVSDHIFREIFNTEYNLSFKRRHTDTCKKCDEINTSLNSSLTPVKIKDQLQQDQKAHHDLVMKINSNFKSDVIEAKESDGKLLVFTFDLQKALETPLLTTSVAFYKRQLWTYNLCIVDEVKNISYMYIWSEDIASRGGQEIGSCLLKHFKENVSSDASKMILYSDSCSGQNKNIKLTMLLKKYLHDLTPDDSLQIIEQKYFVSGHSYNSCDRSFGTIEKASKKSSDIHTPSDWIELIKKSKKSEPLFRVIAMHKMDFVSSAQLQLLIVNRKKDMDGEKINWFNFRTISYSRNEPFILTIMNDDEGVQKICLSKKTSNEESLAECSLGCLFPGGRSISDKKYADLMQLLKYIPEEKHSYFKNLKCDESIDFGLASDISEE